MRKTDLELQEFKRKHPTVPEHCIPTTRNKKKPSNELSFLIIQYIQSIGGQCYRINSQGQYDPYLKRFRKSGMKKGLADLQAIVLGRFIAIEIKIGRDKQSEVQKQRESEIITSGGYYLIAKDFEQFKSDFDKILNRIKTNI